MIRSTLILLAAALAGGAAPAAAAPIEGRVVEAVPDRAAAIRGDAQAQYRVGAYFLDLHVETRRREFGQEAFKWLGASAGQDYGPAQYLLGHMVRSDDPILSSEGLLRAARRGPAPASEARVLAARYLLTGARGERDRDGAAALRELELGAEGEGGREAGLLLARVYARVDLDQRASSVLDRAQIWTDYHAAERWAQRALRPDDREGAALLAEIERLRREEEESHYHDD